MIHDKLVTNSDILTLQVGGTWQPSPDGGCLVGRMVLKKLGHRDARTGQLDLSSEATLLGLKVKGNMNIIDKIEWITIKYNENNLKIHKKNFIYSSYF